MGISNSVVTELLEALPNWRPQMYFKSSLTALSHAMEDQVLAASDQPLIIASFQRERFYKQEAHRYRRIARKTNQVYVLAAPETDFKNSSEIHETIAFEPTDNLAQEWHLVVVGENYASCLICREKIASISKKANLAMDNSRRFEGIWTFERQISEIAAVILLKRILVYRPELKTKIEQSLNQYIEPEILRGIETDTLFENNSPVSNKNPFAQRLVTYLQAGQYKLLKANRSLAAKQQREQLLNSINTAIRRSLDPEKILQVAVQKLGEGLEIGRCLVYRCKENDTTAIINHEFLTSKINSLQGQTWQLENNPLFQEVVKLKESLSIKDTLNDARIQNSSVQNLVQNYSIFAWLIVPVLYQDRLLGVVELHHCESIPSQWKDEDIVLVNAIATQIGVALIQAEAYANLEDLNQQLEALEHTRSNLIAITGHELRTPLSTIQVCLESLASEPDMAQELRQVMLDTALEDAERMRKLVQDFLTLSQLESGRVNWNTEPLSLRECIDLSLSSVRVRNTEGNLPTINTDIDPRLPFIQADGEWLVELLTKLLDNACKFTNADGKVNIAINNHNSRNLVVTVSDTGRGIEPNRLESVFERFYQEEGALRRSTGGTGLGLAICRQIVNGWGGEIWAESAGKNQGSQFHFTVPIVKETVVTEERSSQTKVNRNSKAKINKQTRAKRKTKN